MPLTIHVHLKPAITLLALFASLTVSAVTLGPRSDKSPHDPVGEAQEVDPAPLRLAIPLLDTGVPQGEREQFERRVWPELRNAESVRIAVKLKEALDRRGTFRDVVVAPDTTVSADFYLLARIEASNGEDLRVGWRLVDATQKYWIPASCANPRRCWQRARHRVGDGWHRVHDAALKDPFAALYSQIADKVHRKIADLRKKDGRNRSTKLSDLERAVVTRSLVFASFFSPDLYADAVTERRGRLKLAYVPAQGDADWARVESIKVRDERFAMLVSDQYVGLAAQMQETYSNWQKDSFPLAREARLARREATWSAVAGAIGAAGAVAAAADESNPNNKETAAVLAAASAVAIANSLAERKKADGMHTQINEIGATVQGALRPMVVATQDRTVTLTGTAREQFDQWRELLKDVYRNTATDIEAVRFADSGD